MKYVLILLLRATCAHARVDGIWSDKPVLRTMRETGLCDLRNQLAEENDPKLKAVP